MSKFGTYEIKIKDDVLSYFAHIAKAFNLEYDNESDDDSYYIYINKKLNKRFSLRIEDNKINLFEI